MFGELRRQLPQLLLESPPQNWCPIIVRRFDTINTTFGCLEEYHGLWWGNLVPHCGRTRFTTRPFPFGRTNVDRVWGDGKWRTSVAAQCKRDGRPHGGEINLAFFIPYQLPLRPWVVQVILFLWTDEPLSTDLKTPRVLIWLVIYFVGSFFRDGGHVSSSDWLSFHVLRSATYK